MSVLQALTYKTLQSKAREQPNSSTYDIAPNRSVSIFDVDTAEFELLTESDGHAMGDFDQQGISSASTVVEDQDALEFKTLSKDVYGTLGAPRAYLDMTEPPYNAHVGDALSFTTVQPPRVSMIDSGRDGLQGLATTYIPPVPNPWNLSNPTMPSPEYLASHGILNEIEMSSNSNLGGDANGSSRSADISPERPKKRQRLKSLSSFKKKRLATKGHARNEKVPAAMNTTCNDQASTIMPTLPIPSQAKSLDKDVTLQIIRTDRSAEWDRRRSRTTDLNNAIVIKDVNISNSDRRPLSWPRRNVIRKSLDLSVEALRSKLRSCQIAE